MGNTKIEWTNITWNPVTGCTKVSPGCKHCYAERMSKRLYSMGVQKYANIFNVTLHESVLNTPFGWKQKHLVFVNSMSDIFHENGPEDFIFKIFEVMNGASWHQYQLLTKRSERLVSMSQTLAWGPNIWMGVSIEDNEYLFRVEHLRQTKARIKFLSLEPLLGPLDKLDLAGIDWVIVGGESGPGARKMEREWVVDIRDKCIEAGVPFFFKQWGGTIKKRSGRILDGKTWDEMPSFV
jgi:protein gp37